MYEGRHCHVCGTIMLGEMCPSRYLSDHGQKMIDKVATIVFCQMAADIRIKPNRADWEYAWRWRNEEPILTAVPFPS
jgi:NMD protein affecting ribosome stability and mRNA decay